MSSDKMTKLLSHIDKKFGKGTVRHASEFPPVSFIRSGVPLLDNAFTGGIPRGRIVELWGPPKGGKTSTAALFVGAEQRYQAAQEEPRGQIYLDLENTYNVPWTTKLGVDNETLPLIRHGGKNAKGEPVYLTAEDVINLTWDAAESGAVSLIVWDSLAAMTPQAIIEKHDANNRPVGNLALLMSNYLSEMVKVLNRNDCTLIIINQYREKIGVMYGNPATRPGGNALEHYASQINQIRMGDYYEAKYTDPETGAELGKRRVGNDCRVKNEKNKVGPPFGECTFAFIYDRGIDMESAIRDLALELRVIEQGGRFYRHSLFEGMESEIVNGEKGYIEGKDRILEAFRAHPDLYELIKQECEEVLEERRKGG